MEFTITFNLPTILAVMTGCTAILALVVTLSGFTKQGLNVGEVAFAVLLFLPQFAFSLMYLMGRL